MSGSHRVGVNPPNRPREATLPVPCECVIPWNRAREAGIPEIPVKNRLIHSENLTALSFLLESGFENSIDLIYVDPPFYAGQDFHAHSLNGASAGGEPVYVDRWPGGLPEYLDMLGKRLDLLIDLLAPTGSLMVHLDWHAVHYVKVMLDERLGTDAFRNEIVWCYTGPGSPKMRQFNRKHDTILWYSKGDRWTFEAGAVRQAHHAKTHANFKQGLAGSGFGPDDRVLPPGKVPEDWWEFPVAARFPVDGRRRTGYPTEKPAALLERLLLAASRRGDWVLDAFSGSGTFAYVAARHDRNWIAIDASPLGIHLARKRLIASAREPFTVERMGQADVPHAHHPAGMGECDARSSGFMDRDENFVTVQHTLRLGRNGRNAPETQPAPDWGRNDLWEFGFDAAGNAADYSSSASG